MPARTDAAGSTRVDYERWFKVVGYQGKGRLHEDRESVIVKWVDAKIQRDRMGRGRSKLKKLVKALNHQKVHA